jgi:GNAT superfamily N-acetyltransferase
VFGHDLPMEAWKWKYQRGEEPTAYVAEKDGEVVCHFGAWKRELAWRGKPKWGFDIVDVMCDPRHQGRGLFRRTASAFIRELAAGRSLMFYGFPGERHRRLGERVIGYRPIAPVHKIRRVLDAPPARPSAGVLDGVPRDWDLRVRNVEARFDFVARRERSYLLWRYVARPDRNYRIFTLDGVPSLAVVGIEGEKGYLLEFLVGTIEEGSARRLAEAVEHHCHAGGVREIEAWFPAWAWETRHLIETAGWNSETADHWFECLIFEQEPSPSWLAEHFYYSLGDYDVH